MAFIRLKNVYYKYPGSKDWILKNINLEISRGRILIVGTTGSGKTTLLRILAGLIPEIYGGVLRGVVEREGRIGYVPQNFDAFILMPKVKEELIYVLENIGLDKDIIMEEIAKLSNALGIEKVLEHNISELSMGEKQRVAIASVLALKPEILILDEPLAFIDPSMVNNFLNFIKNLRLKCIIIAEHRIEQLIDFVDRVIVLDKGTIIADDEPFEALRKTPDSIPKPLYIRLGFRSIEEMIEYVNSRRRLV